MWCLLHLAAVVDAAPSGRPSPRPRPRPSPTTKPTMRPTVSPQPTTATPTTVAASTCRSTIATAPTPSLLKANYSSMEDAYDNTQHGHATYECAEILIEELEQYDKAEPYLWCVLDHCAGCDVDGMCPTAYLGLSTTAHCESAVWNYLGFVNRKKATPDYDHAKTYYDKALALWPANCGAMSYMTELYLTTGNTTAARATHADFCAACPSEDAVAAMEPCPTPAPSDVVDAARRRGPGILDGVLMVLSIAVVAYLLSFMACEPPGCGRDPRPFQGNKW